MSAKIVSVTVLMDDGTTVVVPPIATVPVPPPIIPTPTIHRIVQDHSAWAHATVAGSVTPLVVGNETISDGGFLICHSTARVHLANVGNEKGNAAGGGMYFMLGWPDAINGIQQAVSQIVLDATGRTIYQGTAEAAIRLKCDDFQMTGGTVVAHLVNGDQVKPIVEIRHGKSFQFTGVTFQDGYPEIGQQKIAQPDGSSKLDTSQHVGTVTFTNCIFTRWTASKDVYSRKTGVDHVVFVNCVNPDGKTFSRTD